MFDRLGRTAAHHPRRLVIAWLLLVAVAGTLALTGFGSQGLFDRLHSGEPRVPGSESQEARTLIEEASDDGPSVTAVLTEVDLTDPETVTTVGRAAAAMHSRLLATDGVEAVTDAFAFPGGLESEQAAPFVAADGDGLIVTVNLTPDLDSADEEGVHALVVDELTAFGTEIGATTQISSPTLITEAIVGQMEDDLVTGEMVALPISLLVMVVVFGGFLAAGMPLAGALASIAGGLGVLWGFSAVVDLDSVVVNVVTVLGLGLSIDYGLLIVSRFRAEIRREVDAELADTAPGRRRRHAHRRDGAVVRAMQTTMTTAGRTVAFSALIVAIAVGGLLLLRPDILRSLGAAGLSVVVIALLSALTLVPALLAWRGRRMVRPSILMRIPGLRLLLGRFGETAPARGVFSALAERVQRHPWLVLLGTGLVLVFLASPLLGLQMRNSTIDLLPPGTEQRDVIETIERQYPMLGQPPVQVLVETGDEDALADQIARIDDVAGVDPAQPVSEEHMLLGVRLADGIDPGGAEAATVVESIRDMREGTGAGADSTFWVLGQAANQIDFTDALVDGLPIAVSVVVLATLVLLFLMTGSILVPLKALAVNTLSLAASLGVTTWVFQEGHLSGLLGFEPVGGLESYVVAVVVAFGFGLAMDYEVFLIARIKEFYDGGAHGSLAGDNDAAVRDGLQQSGRIITSAALVIIVVFAGFISGELVVIKQAGFALAATVLIDATLVRMLLVPATMTLLGHRNWWAPRPLRALHGRFGIAH
ncbi:MMPL family transporter [Ruania halotolerans]|uniref:MMPL family transporter n=1 Tax=Ruania halotolerans TaxID=2897773 RepID=UPI001E55198A|nr:MMPL family transporter [Ruania halotolerans]UFU04751.1 MMPL family transporter [Ruania halotolerans]